MKRASRRPSREALDDADDSIASAAARQSALTAAPARSSPCSAPRSLPSSTARPPIPRRSGETHVATNGANPRPSAALVFCCLGTTCLAPLTDKPRPKAADGGATRRTVAGPPCPVPGDARESGLLRTRSPEGAAQPSERDVVVDRSRAAPPPPPRQRRAAVAAARSAVEAPRAALFREAVAAFAAAARVQQRAVRRGSAAARPRSCSGRLPPWSCHLRVCNWPSR